MTPTRTRSKVLSISGSELSEACEVGQSEDRHVGGFSRRGGSEARTQLGGTRARIDLGFRVACRHHRLADPVEGRGTLVSDRHMARARCLAGAIGEEGLDDAVFQRMEG